jgi:hypothetical protein
MGKCSTAGINGAKTLKRLRPSKLQSMCFTQPFQPIVSPCIANHTIFTTLSSTIRRMPDMNLAQLSTKRDRLKTEQWMHAGL